MSPRASGVGVVAASKRHQSVILGSQAQPVIGTQSDNGRMYVSSFTLAANGTVTDFHIWCAATTAAGNVKGLIYADSSGSPGAQKYASGSRNVTNASYHYEDFTGLSVALTAGTYWLGWITQSISTIEIGFTATGSYKGKTSGGNFATPDDPFGSTDTSGTRLYAVYATVV